MGTRIPVTLIPVTIPVTLLPFSSASSPPPGNIPACQTPCDPRLTKATENGRVDISQSQ
jgi:hypothetical protein